MKFSIFLFFICCFWIYPQQKCEYSPEVEEFMKEVDSYSLKQGLNKNIVNDLSYDQTKELAKKMYIAIANDPQGYENYISLKHKEWEDKIERKEIDPGTPKFGAKLNFIEEQIKLQLSPELLHLIKIPYFVKVTITAKEKAMYTDIEDNIPLAQVIVKGEINEVIKGNANFILNEEITFFYLSLWFQHSKCSPDFLIGKSYFIPLTLTIDEDKKTDKLALGLINDNSCSVYAIENEIIYTPNNYFKIGKETPWLQFKKEFFKNYILQ